MTTHEMASPTNIRIVGTVSVRIAVFLVATQKMSQGI